MTGWNTSGRNIAARRSIFRLTMALATPFAAMLAATPSEAWAQAPLSIASPDDQKADDAALAALDKNIKFGFEDAPLTDVIDFLADQLNTPCRIDGHALDEEGIARDTPVTYKSAGQPAKHALSAILAQLELDWIVDRGAVVITTRGKVHGTLRTRVYPVKDLVSEDEKPWGEELTHVITTSLDPLSWNSGGGAASIVAAPSIGVIVVSQNRQVHEQIVGLLAALRAAHDQ